MVRWKLGQLDGGTCSATRSAEARRDNGKWKDMACRPIVLEGGSEEEKVTHGQTSLLPPRDGSGPAGVRRVPRSLVVGRSHAG